MSGQNGAAPPTGVVKSSVTLTQLPPRAQAHVTAVTGEPADASRLKSLGICLGRRIQLVKAGDPLVVRVLGTRVGLSWRLAHGVLVEQI